MKMFWFKIAVTAILILMVLMPTLTRAEPFRIVGAEFGNRIEATTIRVVPAAVEGEAGSVYFTRAERADLTETLPLATTVSYTCGDEQLDGEHSTLAPYQGRGGLLVPDIESGEIKYIRWDYVEPQL
ncbi:MAG: hypothetical protein HQL48_05180 [Gammaproteobacteria bacterium]|nr:hypothetical protein [Gammaproteobacteria bacterium]